MSKNNIIKILSDKKNSICIQKMECKKNTNIKRSTCVYSSFYDDKLYHVVKFYKPISRIFLIFIFFLLNNVLYPQNCDISSIIAEKGLNYGTYLEIKNCTDYRANIEFIAQIEVSYSRYIEALKKADTLRNMKGINNNLFTNCILIPLSSIIDSIAINNQVIMIGEVHHNPKYRAALFSIMKKCYDHGYTYLALETLYHSDTMLQQRKYPLINKTGWYINEPIFGDVVRQAIKMGYKLIPYERISETQKEYSRDKYQAINLINNTIDKDSTAKILVFVGMGHHQEGAGMNTLGRYFKELSKIDPFTIDLLGNGFFEKSEKKYETDAQRMWLNYIDSLNINEAVIFYDTVANKYKSIFTDVIGLLPRNKYIFNKIPTWKVFNDKVLYTIPHKVFKNQGMETGLVSAFLFDEGKEAVPVDQIEFNNKEDGVLVLYKGKYLLCFDNGKIKKYKTVTVK